MNVKASLLRLLFLALLMTGVVVARGDETTYGPGCYKCREHTTIFGAADDSCEHVANNTAGDGIYCTEQQLVFSQWCRVTGGGCYYTEVTGGGGGGGGTGTGGETGPRNETGGCSAEYASCG